VSERRVAIVGGGIVGLSIALALRERGFAVTLIDRGVSGARASHGNAGIVNPGSIFPLAGPNLRARLVRYAVGADPALRIRWRALPAFAPWLCRLLANATVAAWRRGIDALAPVVAAAPAAHRALADRYGAGALYRAQGWLRVYRDARAFAASASERALLGAYGVKTAVVSGRHLYDLEPALARGFSHGLWFVDAVTVDTPGALVAALEAALDGRGGRRLTGSVRAIGLRADSVSLTLDRSAVVADLVVIAAGAHADALIRPLGYRLPLAAERGYHVHVRLTDGARLARPVHDAAGAYVAAPMAGAVRLTTGVELARADDPPSRAPLASAIAAARAVLPVADIVPGSEWCGSRPSTPDGLPVIGIAPRHPRLLFAFGHGHIGLATAPVTAQAIAALIADEPAPFPLAPFSPDRFG
jgi:D-amino-acid dehydrogenase